MAPRTAYVSEHLLELAEDVDPAAPGAAITRELCGHWEHEGACRWPHHTAAAPVSMTDDSAVGGRERVTTDDSPMDGEERVLRVRTVFVCASTEEQDVRARIDAALNAGTYPPEPPGWSVHSSTVSNLTPDEGELAGRLSRT